MFNGPVEGTDAGRNLIEPISSPEAKCSRLRPHESSMTGSDEIPWVRVIALCCKQAIVARSLCVALMVGTIVNLINQGDALISGGDMDVLKLVLTYGVPYAATSYIAVSERMASVDFVRPKSDHESPPRSLD